MKKIGLILIATGKYDTFIQQLISSADEFFMKGHQVTYFLFTDSKLSIVSDRNIIVTKRKHQPFPYATLLRYNCFSGNKDLFKEQDYLFYSDIDMKFVSEVSDEILSKRVVTLHPGYVGERGDPETNPKSKAYISDIEEMKYFAGGFNGGETQTFLEMSDILDFNIQDDLNRGIKAKWDDESHLNRYMIDNPPTKILDPGYCYPENLKLDYTKRLLALDKNHKQIRTNLKCAVIMFHKNIEKNYKEKWWRLSVETMLKQTYQDFDFFEINYGGKDWSIINQYEGFEQKHFFYSQKFKNHAQAMNFIIDEVFKNGYDVVFNTNMDDYYDLSRIDKQIDYILDGYDIVSSNFDYVLDFRDDDYRLKEFDFSDLDIKSELDLNHNIVAHPVVCFTKNVWTKMRYNDTLIPKEDLDFWQRAVSNGFKIKIVPDTLLHYRVHDNQTSYKKKKFNLFG